MLEDYSGAEMPRPGQPDDPWRSKFSFKQPHFGSEDFTGVRHVTSGSASEGMNEQKLRALYDRYQAGDLSPEEKDEFLDAIRDSRFYKLVRNWHTGGAPNAGQSRFNWRPPEGLE